MLICSSSFRDTFIFLICCSFKNLLFFVNEVFFTLSFFFLKDLQKKDYALKELAIELKEKEKALEKCEKSKFEKEKVKRLFIITFNMFLNLILFSTTIEIEKSSFLEKRLIFTQFLLLRNATLYLNP